jgi:sigma-B regulation protein RsbU (phosphoserine phosphatase)
MSETTKAADAAKASILVVDDTRANLRFLANILTLQGYTVRPAINGTMALTSAQAKPPDLILLDILMPDMNGYEVCAQLKADPATRDIPVIFLSALNEVLDKVRAFDIGGVDYITKPFQVEEVVVRVETHLALRNLQRCLEEKNVQLQKEIAAREQELALAGQIQASFLATTLPEIPGWQMSMALKPARVMSGDFYDIHALPNGGLGVLIADVVDKGVGAALYMALSCTLFRTYAAEYPTQPERVISAVNRRLLADTEAKPFITAFYGVLDPATGTLTYCNAGHNPPYWAQPQRDGEIYTLAGTGTPLGIFEDRAWAQETVQLAHGDTLVLYTDGITDAQNTQEAFFDEERLRASVQANLGRSAGEIQEAVQEALFNFVGQAPQRDDIALVIVVRE